MAFLPDGRILLVEKRGSLNIVDPETGESNALSGGPDNVLKSSDSGLLDVVLDPDFETNQRLFLAFAEGSSSLSPRVLAKQTALLFGVRASSTITWLAVR